jgi:TetR/AcrR family transcriptional repressor of mexJK operon
MVAKTDALSGRELLLEVACDLFMQAGYDGVSMQQIAEAAHMTKGSPYYHFKGKEDLFSQAFLNRTDQVFAGMMSALEQDGDLRTRLVDALTYVISTANSGMIRLFEDFRRCVGPEQLQKFEAQKHIKVNPEAMIDTFQKVFERAIAEGEPLRLPPERAANIFLSLQMGTMHILHMEGFPALGPDDVHTLVTDTVDTFLYGVTAPATTI